MGRTTSRLSFGRTRRFLRLLDLVSKLRDAVLVVAGLVVSLGLAVWALTSWRLGLGPVAGLNAQYFVGGLFLLGGLVLVAFLLKGGFESLYVWWPRQLERLTTRRLVIAGVLPLSILVLVWIAGGLQYAKGDMRQTVVSLFLLLFAAHFAVASHVVERRRRVMLSGTDSPTPDAAVETDRSLWLLSRSMLVLALVGAFAVGRWIIDRYGDIPQEFGGARPRCAALDVQTEALSPATLGALGLDTAPSSQQPRAVLRTPFRRIYFASEQVLLVEAVPVPGMRAMRLEIPKRAINSIQWATAAQCRNP